MTEDLVRMAGSAVVVVTSHCPSRAADNQNMKTQGLGLSDLKINSQVLIWMITQE